jgi:hypothetical protein
MMVLGGMGGAHGTAPVGAACTVQYIPPDARPPAPVCTAMNVFYGLMAVLIVGTFVPSVLFMLLYMFTGRHEALWRARALWNFSRVFTMLGINILIWGHVFVGLWHIWF